MSNLVSFEAGGVPAHIARRFAEQAGNSDLSGGVGMGYPILSYKGKVWHVVQGENRTLIANDDGEPRSSIEVVLLKSNPALSKIYYEGGYEEGANAKPTCYSNDSVAPAPDATDKQATKCAICPHNQWGSRITEQGGKGKACSDSRRLAVAPVGDLESPMLLRVPAGSLKELAAYAEMLNKRKTPYNAVLTKIGFDHTVAHQKFTFKALGYLTDEQYDTVEQVVDRDVIGAITGISGASAATEAEEEIPGTPPSRLSGAAKAEPVQQAPAAPVEKPKTTSAFSSASSDEVTEAVQPKAEKPKAEKPKAKPQQDHSALLSEAAASLDDVLSMLDD